MEKEFNLWKEREKLISLAIKHKWNIIEVLSEVEKQEKEFIKKLLTPNNISKGFVEVSTIKYYAGDKLV